MDAKVVTAPTELLPCPFCGGRSDIWTPPITLGDDMTDVDYLSAYCTKCGVSGINYRFTDHRRDSADFLGAKSKAITAWNTRAIEAAEADLLGRCLEALRELRRNNQRGITGVEARKTWTKVNAILSQVREVRG